MEETEYKCRKALVVSLIEQMTELEKDCISQKLLIVASFLRLAISALRSSIKPPEKKVGEQEGMMYIETSRLIVLIASAAITFGFYAQAWKLWQTHSAKDFSAALVIAVVINELAWLNYGFALREWPVIAVGFANMPAAIAIAVGYSKYRRE